MELKQGSTLQGNKYKIIKVLGQGGFGITYLAQHTLLERTVAIKEFFFKEYCDRDRTTSRVTIGTSGNRDVVDRFKVKFLKEAKTISKLKHPNIVQIHDVFEENNTAYYVMEYIEGRNLSDMVKKNGPLNEVRAIKYIKDIAQALTYIHGKKINHLDIKPGNIMLRNSDDKAILIDFGLSKQYDESGTQTSSTPVGISQGYAPIEQYRAGGVSSFSPETDIYSLGATLYWLVIGKTPPAADDILNYGFPELPNGISASVKNAIAKAMKASKIDRPANVEEFLNNFKATKINEETEVVITPEKPRIPKFPLIGQNNELFKKLVNILKWAGIVLIGFIVFCVVVATCSDKKSDDDDWEDFDLEEDVYEDDYDYGDTAEVDTIAYADSLAEDSIAYDY